MDRLYTLGHSSRDWAEFIRVLAKFEIELVVDVRTVPKSKRNPQYNQNVMPPALKEAGIRYHHLRGLGGLRKPNPDSHNTGWRNAAFRGYADYMQTADFETSLQSLLKLAVRRRTVILCAESVPWHCHRSLIADALVVRGVDVFHIMSETRSQPHALRDFVKVDGTRVSYPPVQEELFGS